MQLEHIVLLDLLHVRCVLRGTIHRQTHQMDVLRALMATLVQIHQQVPCNAQKAIMLLAMQHHVFNALEGTFVMMLLYNQ